MTKGKDKLHCIKMGKKWPPLWNQKDSFKKLEKTFINTYLIRNLYLGYKKSHTNS
jgi:hypothetical protein